MLCFCKRHKNKDYFTFHFVLFFCLFGKCSFVLKCAESGDEWVSGMWLKKYAFVFAQYICILETNILYEI